MANSNGPGSHFLVVDDSWAGGVEQGSIGPDLMLICPVCHFNYAHLGEPERLYGWESREGLGKVKFAWAGRGDGWLIPVWGECGHNWSIRFGFHKGNTFVFVVRGEDDPEQPE